MRTCEPESEERGSKVSHFMTEGGPKAETTQCPGWFGVGLVLGVERSGDMMVKLIRNVLSKEREI